MHLLQDRDRTVHFAAFGTGVDERRIGGLRLISEMLSMTAVAQKLGAKAEPYRGWHDVHVLHVLKQ